LEQVRNRWPGVVRILLTGHSDIESTIAAINRSEIRRYISKPWNNHQLQLVVREALDNKRVLEEKQRLEALTLRQNEDIRKLYDQVLAAQKISERLLLNVLPRVIVERLKEGDVEIAGMQRVGDELFVPLIADGFPDVSVLFADIVGFTKLAAAAPPRELVFLLNEIFSEFDTVTDTCGLEKIKTIGDCYMAVAGVPESVTGHATRAAHAALNMFEVLADFNRRNGYNLQMRAGINSGSVVAGVIGKNKFIYDLWGDTVIIASRMESRSLAGRVQITDATRQQLGDEFSCEDRGKIKVKGVREPIHTWFLNRPSRLART
jgi:class 3 adenylate cyclase